MASALAIDPATGDLAVASGGFTSVEGLSQTRQHLWTRLSIIRGELAYDTDAGVPIVEEVAVKGTPPERIATIYREVILGTPEVDAFAEGGAPRLAFDPVTRKANVSFRAESESGLIDFSEQV